METINENTRICPLCGKKIHYRNVYEDGSDWLGHQRGSSKSYILLVMNVHAITSNLKKCV